jgi:hypothetical protein
MGDSLHPNGNLALLGMGQRTEASWNKEINLHLRPADFPRAARSKCIVDFPVFRAKVSDVRFHRNNFPVDCDRSDNFQILQSFENRGMDIGSISDLGDVRFFSELFCLDS